jgi:drug/metabolite transporter (DMT)-like permease
MLMGIFLFGLNYWMVYVAELTLPSGLVALIFSTIIFMNVFNGALFLKSPINLAVVLGGITGITGVFFIFKKEILSFNLSNKATIALIITLISVFLASLGNIISARNQRAGLPVLQANVFGMLYGGIFTLLISLIGGKPFSFEFSVPYITSLLFLAIFGSIIAFGCYLTLIGRIGADKAAYIAFISPIFALLLSTLFEGYIWSIEGILGVMLILLGNLMVLWKKSTNRKVGKN